MNAVVLDEDTYTEALSHIIQRDFYPKLAKMKAEAAYHEARLAGDRQQVKRITDLLIQLHKDETDLAKRVNLQLSLDQFQTVYTSEDNASFDDLLAKTNAKRKDAYRWYYDKNADQLRIEDMQAPNLLMYYPQGTSRSLLEDKDSGAASRQAPKAISHANTSFEPPIVSTSSTAPAIHPITMQDPVTKNIRGYGMVESTPLIDPGAMDEPLMTWGDIEGTPIQIRGNDTPATGRQFSLPKESARERLGMQLSEQASKAYRKRTSERIVRGTPRVGSGLFSPAAQHLLRKSTPQTRSFDSALRSSYAGQASSSSKRKQ
ncbi:nuclear protein Es2-domain-containing protein [Gongronella butleri]|nr:nuclear protein Es2-domain-containing protein [Gongronella butleri]